MDKLETSEPLTIVFKSLNELSSQQLQPRHMKFAMVKLQPS